LQPVEIIVIPGGQAELRKKVTVDGKQLLQEASYGMFAWQQKNFPDVKDFADIPASDYDGDLVKEMHGFQRGCVVAILKSWSLDEPLPTMATIGEMDPDLYEVLVDKCQPLANAALVGTDLAPALKEDGTLDRENPTQTSPDSEKLSDPPPETDSDPTPPPPPPSSEDGAATDTDDSSPQ
jgi:hypothetical protein